MNLVSVGHAVNKEPTRARYFEENGRTMHDHPTGQVVLDCITSVSYIAAARIAVRVAQEFPGVSLRILEGYAGYQIDWLQPGENNLALLYGPASDLHLPVTHVMYEELVLVSPIT